MGINWPDCTHKTISGNWIATVNLTKIVERLKIDIFIAKVVFHSTKLNILLFSFDKDIKRGTCDCFLVVLRQ